MRRRDSSIRARLKAIIALQVFICAGLFVFLSVSKLADAYRAYEQSTVQAAALFCAQAVGVIDTAVEASKFPGRINNTNAPQTFIATALQRGNIQMDFSFCSQFYSSCKSMMEQYPSLDTMAVYQTDGAAVYASRHRDNYYVTQAPKDAPWLLAAIENRGAETVTPPALLAAQGFGPLYAGCVVVARGIFNPWRLKTQGVFLVSVSVDTLDQAFAGARVQSEQAYTLYYNDQPFISAFDAEGSSAAFAALPLRGSQNRIVNNQGRLYMDVLYRYNRHSGLVIRTPLSSVTSTVLELNLALLVLLTVTLGLIIVLIRRLLRSVLTPLERLTSAFDQTTGTFFPTVSSTLLPSDLQPVFSAYNRMSERIDLLVNEGLRKDVAQRETELQLLRTQINPHYLYNTLECIHMRAYTNRDFEVARMAELLGANLQYGLRATTRTVTLQTELAKAQEYMTLVSYHYGERVRFTTYVDAEILPCPVIKLLLQPLIENAIQHGLKPDAPLNIELLGYGTEAEIYLQISDDGTGIRPEALQALQAELDSPDAGNGIGLRNVHRRLKLNYGEHYGVRVSSLQNVSTVVTLNLPRQMKGGAHGLPPAAGG